MYLRTLAFVLLALPLCGCELPFGNDNVSWALINKAKIQAVVSNDIKQKNPYPAELSSDYAARQKEYAIANQQIAELKRSAMQRCIELNQNEEEKKGANQMQERVSRYSLMAQNTQVKSCIQDMENDPLILDLKDKTKAFSQLQQQRREHDLSVQKIVNEIIDSAVADYARDNGFSLIITNEQSVAYSDSKQILDVTNAVVDRIKPVR